MLYHFTLHKCTCTVCGNTFESPLASAKFCSRDCKKAHAAQQMRDERGSVPLGSSVSAVCQCCHKLFTYKRCRKPRLYCDDCSLLLKRKRRYRKKPSVYPLVDHQEVCLFCGKPFNTASHSKFCHQCRREKFDEVYKFRKQSNPNWLSPGDRVLKGMPAVPNSPSCDFPHWLAFDMTNPHCHQSNRCGFHGELAMIPIPMPVSFSD